MQRSTIPNAITVARIALCPLVAWLLFVPTFTSRLLAFIFFLIAAFSDLVDGHLARTGLVITTGGLGPTRDDFTKPVIAKLYGRELIVQDDLLEKSRARWRQRGMEMPESNRSQAEVPEGARVMPNRLGSAPGIAIEDERGLTIMLPGVPHELRDLTMREVIPFLLASKAHAARRTHPMCYRIVRVTGVPESALAERIDDIIEQIAPISMAFLPDFSGVDLRMTSWGLFDAAESERRFDEGEKRLRERLGTRVYASGNEEIEVVVGRMLKERKLTLATAESCTGGLLGGRITKVDGASAYYMGGFVTYSNDAKVELLGVRAETLQSKGAVSEETAREMAVGAAARMGTNAAISITGVAGPGGGTQEKPVGLVWTGVSVNDVVKTRNFVFPGDRAEIRQRSTQMGLALLYEMLADLP